MLTAGILRHREEPTVHVALGTYLVLKKTCLASVGATVL